MLKSDVLEFLTKIDQYLVHAFQRELNATPLPIRIVGKCALLLAGMNDPVGTVDLDSLAIEATEHNPRLKQIVEGLVHSFGPEQRSVHGYYLQFISEAMLFLPGRPNWLSLQGNWKCLAVTYLAPHDTIASKCFSAFSQAPRKKDLKDVTEALDQGLVDFRKILQRIDLIFDANSMDARADRFPRVYQYILDELIPNYGPDLSLKYSLSDE